MEINAAPLDAALITLEPGDDVIDSLKSAFERLGFTRAVWVGAGELEDVEWSQITANGQRVEQKLQGSVELVSLVGQHDERGVEARVVLCRSAEGASSCVGGVLVRATAVSVALQISGVGGHRPARAVSAPTPPTPAAAAPVPPPPAEVRGAPAASPPAPPVQAAAVPPPAAQSGPQPSAGQQQYQQSPPVPRKLGRREEQFDAYPEENDVVTHFAFGRCVVLFSDGERLRLQQDKDSRVREVALSMLRIEEPQIMEDGRKHWDLSRKN